MPCSDPKVFNDSNDVVTALKQNQVDAVVTDLPTAFYITAAQVPGSKIAGQFERAGRRHLGRCCCRRTRRSRRAWTR